MTKYKTIAFLTVLLPASGSTTLTAQETDSLKLLNPRSPYDRLYKQNHWWPNQVGRIQVV